MDFIPLASPDIRDEDIYAVSEVLKTGMLVQGKCVAELENSFVSLIKTNNAIAVSNGTATLHLALIALGIQKGDEVIVPAFSYVATANVVELCGATPVFIDIDSATFNIDVAKIEQAITHKTKAIIPVHEFGLSCDIEGVMDIAKRHNLFVIEDAACALGAMQNGKMVGSFGHFGSFSLHPRKAISSGEGGVLTTNDHALSDKVRILRNHGIEMINGKMEFVEAGFNYRMTDFQAALVSSQMKRLKTVFEKKNKLAHRYFEQIKQPKVTLPFVPGDRNHTWQTFHIVVDDEIDRDALIEKFKKNGIGSNYGAQCIPAQIFYQRKYKLNCDILFPNALRAFRKGLALPIYEKLSINEIDYISEQINTI